MNAWAGGRGTATSALFLHLQRSKPPPPPAGAAACSVLARTLDMQPHVHGRGPCLLATRSGGACAARGTRAVQPTPAAAVAAAGAGAAVLLLHAQPRASLTRRRLRVSVSAAAGGGGGAAPAAAAAAAAAAGSARAQMQLIQKQLTQATSAEAVLQLCAEYVGAFDHIHAATALNRVGQFCVAESARRALRADVRLAAMLDALQQRVVKLNAQGVANCLWGLARLAPEFEAPPALLAALHAAAGKPSLWMDAAPQAIANAAWALVRLSPQGEPSR
jgi:hypothetical protein